MRDVDRAISNTVPDPITWFLGNPLSFHATYVMMSTGLLATTKIPLKLFSFKALHTPFVMFALILTKSKRV